MEKVRIEASVFVISHARSNFSLSRIHLAKSPLNFFLEWEAPFKSLKTKNWEDQTNLILFLLYIICRLNQLVTDPGLLLVQGTSLHVLLVYCLSMLSALIWFYAERYCTVVVHGTLAAHNHPFASRSVLDKNSC